VEPQPADLVTWEEDPVAGLLGMKGRLLHAAAGAAEADWIYTELDLAAIAPPLTRIANRYEPIRRYATHADPVAVAAGIFAYATRSMLERRVAAAAAAGDGGTRPIPSADGEPVVPESAAPAPPVPPRSVETRPEPPPMQPSEGPAAVGPPRPAEADVDPTAIRWEV
jgi:hypothetical protein